MTVSEFLTRARSALGKNVKYKLGAGGISPTTPTPANIHNECDCSGYVCWCLGISRKTDHPLYVNFNGGWINTDAIVRDANQPTGFFGKLAAPKVGCLVVFPSRPPNRKVGHVGIVTQINSAGDKVLKVIHCSSGNFRNFGDAIKETPPSVFQQSDTIFVWYEGLVV